MPETLDKIRLYVRPGHRYWTSVPAADRERDAILYPINFAPRLADGHFSHFDERGLPLRPTSTGYIHNYTRICGWALAHCGLARAGRLDPTGQRSVILAADYVAETGVEVDAGLHLRAEIPGSGHVGGISAMAQGQAMSVLVRAHRLTADDRYLEAARGLVGPFRTTLQAGGVVSPMADVNEPWFEEDVRTPPRHILNGMIFALWGLADVARHADHREAGDLYAAGVHAIGRNIHRFDRGWWSNYDAPDAARPYLASMRYHDLHVAQLEVLAEEAPQLGEVARRFSRYAAVPRRRFRAAVELAVAKVRRDYRHGP